MNWFTYQTFKDKPPSLRSLIMLSSKMSGAGLETGYKSVRSITPLSLALSQASHSQNLVLSLLCRLLKLPPMEAARKELEDAVMKKKITKSFWKRKWTLLDKRAAGGLLFMHFLTLFAPFTFTWGAFYLAFTLYLITGHGITISFHRNLAHRSFKLPKWLEYLLAYCACHAFQGDPIDWVSIHRYHHQFVDTERDPHSPIDGFWFSHMSWMFDSVSLTGKVTPESLGESKNRNPSLFRNAWVAYLKYGKPTNVGDLEKQAFYRFLRRTYILHIVGCGVVLYAVGGLPYLVWGLGVRTVWVLHITFAVNSACHIWGKRQWRTRDLSKNNWLVGLLAFGEGWHNNHHAFEYSARQGLEWWQIDTSWGFILLLQALGLATDVKLPSEMQKQKMALRKEEVSF